MKKLATVGMALLLLVIAVAAIAIPLLTGRTNRKLEARQAAVRAQGLPADLTELDAWYAWPATTVENGAAYVEAAPPLLLDTVQHPDETNALPLVHNWPLPPASEPLTPDLEKRISAAVSANSNSLAMLRASAKMKSSRYSIDLTRGLETNLPHHFTLHTGAALLSLEAVVQAEHGEIEVAIENIGAAMGLGETLAEEPEITSQIVRCRIQAHCALPALSRLLSRAAPSDAQLVELATVLREAESRGCFYRGAIGARCDWDAAFDEPPLFLKTSIEFPRLLDASRLTGLLARERLWHWDCMTAYVEAARATVDARPALVEQADRMARGFPWYALVSRTGHSIGQGQAGDVMMESVRHAVLLRSAGTALAVERCRLAHGRLPEKLEDLVPEFLEAVPVDPFTRASLMYRPEGPGYLIYSLGTDRDDDGGVPEKAAQWGVSLPPQGDLSFRVDHPGPEE